MQPPPLLWSTRSLRTDSERLLSSSLGARLGRPAGAHVETAASDETGARWRRAQARPRCPHGRLGIARRAGRSCATALSRQAKGAARGPVGRPDAGAPKSMERSSQPVAAAFPRMQERGGRPSDACTSSIAIARQQSARTLAPAASRDHIVHPQLIAGDRGRFRFDSGAVHRHVARFNQARSARLAVAPRHVDDPPALPRLQELEKINVERAPNGGARDAIRHILDFDLDPAIVDVLSPPHTARGHLDHLWSRDRADAFGARGVLLERALGRTSRARGGRSGGRLYFNPPRVVSASGRLPARSLLRRSRVRWRVERPLLPR